MRAVVHTNLAILKMIFPIIYINYVYYVSMIIFFIVM